MSPDAERIRLAEEFFASPADPFRREAGAQMLAGLAAPEALRLLERACADRDARVVEGGLRALLQSVTITAAAAAATASSAAAARRSAEASADAAESVLLRVLAGTPAILDGGRARALLLEGERAVLGAAVPSGAFDARRFSFLAANPDLARCRLRCLGSGSHRAVQSARSARLRANPAFGALFDVIRADPDLRRALLPVLLRRGEFVGQSGQGGPSGQGRGQSGSGRPDTPLALEPFWGDVRRMSGLLASLATDPTLAALTGVMVDRGISRQSAALWARLRAGASSAAEGRDGGIPYVPEVVVGSGPHAANLCTALATLRPEAPPLVVERRDRIGGQFAVPGGGASWRLNSRARPAAPDRRGQPGGAGALNSLGAYAPVQEADITGQSYAAQDRLAWATRMSLFVSSYAMVGTEAGRWLRNSEENRRRLGLAGTQSAEQTGGGSAAAPPPSAPPDGRYLVPLTNRATGETCYVSTDAVIFAGGLGGPSSAFRDRASRGAIAKVVAADAPAAGAGEGGVGRERGRRAPRAYYAFDGFMERLASAGSGGDPFPLRGAGEVIVVGAGDSGRVAVEALLGYGPDGATGRSVQTLDRVRRVTWIGQGAATREEFLSCERPRYHALALEFPRAGGGGGGGGTAAAASTAASATPRILPVAGRAVRFSVEGGRAVVVTTAGDRYEADTVIDCAGFGGRGGGGQNAAAATAAAAAAAVPEPLASLPAAAALRLRAGARLQLCIGSESPAERVLLAFREVVVGDPDRSRRRIVGTARSFLGRFALSAETPFSTDPCEAGGLGAELERAALVALRIPADKRLFLRETVRPVVDAASGGEPRRAVARQEAGEDIFYVGPCAGLPSDATLPAGAAGAEEMTAALWRHAEAVTTFAEHYFGSLARGGLPTRSGDGAGGPRLEPVFLVHDLLPPKPPRTPPAAVVTDAGDAGRGAEEGGQGPGPVRTPLSPAAVRAGVAPWWPPAHSGAACGIPATGDTARLLRYAICEHLRGYRLFPPRRAPTAPRRGRAGGDGDGDDLRTAAEGEGTPSPPPSRSVADALRLRIRFTPRVEASEGGEGNDGGARYVLEAEVEGVARGAAASTAARRSTASAAAITAATAGAVRPLLEAMVADPLVQAVVIGRGFPSPASVRSARGALPTAIEVAVRPSGRLLLRGIRDGD